MTTEDKPVDRDAWRRLLDGDGDGPPELTDARIRAKARQALTPRTGRWWLPASLAASLLIAVVLVQRQYEPPRATAVVSESDYATAPAEAPSATTPGELSKESQLRQDARPTDEPAPVALGRAAPPASAAREPELDDFVPAPPAVPSPTIEVAAMGDRRATAALPAGAPAADSSANAAPEAEAKRDEEVGEIVVSANRVREDNRESPTPVTQATSADVSDRRVAHSGGLLKAEKAERSPEEWYAAIEKLRAAGKKQEAKLELEKLEKAHPGWLKENHPTER